MIANNLLDKNLRDYEHFCIDESKVYKYNHKNIINSTESLEYNISPIFIRAYFLSGYNYNKKIFKCQEFFKKF